MSLNLTCDAVVRAELGEPAKREGAELLYRCPHPECHKNGDSHPSLKINTKKDIWGCFVCGMGGTAWQLAAFIAGVEPGDKAAVKTWLKGKGLFSDTPVSKPVNGAGKPMGKLVATHDFVDESGKLLYQEVRFEPKDFKLRRPDGEGGWVWHLECNDGCKCGPKIPPVRRASAVR